MPINSIEDAPDDLNGMIFCLDLLGGRRRTNCPARFWASIHASYG